MHNGDMITQLVVRQSGDRAKAELDTLPNPGGTRAPISFEDKKRGLLIPRFGTPALIRLAGHADHAQLRASRFELVDMTGAALPDVESGQVSDELLARLREGGAEAVMETMLTRFATYEITGVQFLTDGGDGFIVRRDGVADLEPDVPAVAFLSEAWHDLDIS